MNYLLKLFMMMDDVGFSISEMGLQAPITYGDPNPHHDRLEVSCGRESFSHNFLHCAMQFEGENDSYQPDTCKPTS